MVVGVCGDVRRLVRDSPDSLSAIARRAGISRATLGRLLRGERVGTLSLEKLARQLGFDLSLTLRRDAEALVELQEATP